MQMMTGACVKFGGINLYRTNNQKNMQKLLNETDLSGLSVSMGQRQLGPTHELVELTGRDVLNFYELTMDGIVFPETLKALPPEEAFEQLETNPEFAPLRNKMDQFQDAMSTGGMFDLAPALAMTTALFEYLGYCTGRGKTADNTPVNVINLDA
jgi:hypothetical protein